MDKTLAVHQPNYLPWLGYFHKIASADIFVFLDSVQFPRGQSVANRNKIKTSQGWQWLTVPISIPSGRKGKATYLEVALANDTWRKKHLKTIQMNYSRAPYFQPHFDYISKILLENHSFAQTNINLIRYFLEQLEIETPLYRLSELKDISGKNNELIINLCHALGADTYLSGLGALKYNNPANYQQSHIHLEYQNFTSPQYPQQFGEFIPNLSIVDLLFNCGPESKEILLGDQK